MKIKAELIHEPKRLCPAWCQVEKVVEVDGLEFDAFLTAPQEVWPFLEDNAEMMHQWMGAGSLPSGAGGVAHRRGAGQFGGQRVRPVRGVPSTGETHAGRRAGAGGGSHDPEVYRERGRWEQADPPQ